MKILMRSEQCSAVEANIAKRFDLSAERLFHLEQNATAWLGDQEVVSYLALLSELTNKKIAVIDSMSIRFRGTIERPENVVFGAIDTCDFILFPVFISSHWTLLIHDNQNSTSLFLDSLQTFPSRLEWNYSKYFFKRKNNSNEDMTDNFHQISIGDRIKDIFLDINRQHIRPTEIRELNAGIDFNRQTDTWNCGIFICLFCEEFLFADKFMVENLDINKERARILRNLRKLMVTDNIDFEYRRQRINFDDLTNTNGKQLRKSFVPLSTKANIQSTEAILMDLKRNDESSTDKENRLSDKRKRQKNIRDSETATDKEDRLADQRKRQQKVRETKKAKLPPLYRAAENWINVDKFEFVSTILNIKCKHCVAKHWWEELTQENQRKQNFSFEKCCHHGKVRLDKLPDYPKILRQLMEGKHIDSKAFRWDSPHK